MADVAIRNVTVLSVDEKRVLEHQEILIRDGRIAALRDQPSPPSEARILIDGSDLIAMPGFVDTHTHLWQHVAKSFRSDGSLQEWIPAVYPLAHYLTRDELYDVTLG